MRYPRKRSDCSNIPSSTLLYGFNNISLLITLTSAYVLMVSPFAVCFIGHSFPIPAESFVQTSPTQWVLDVVATVTPEYWNLKEITLFLTAPNILDPSLGLGLYVHNGESASEWQYRGCVHATHPSEAMPLVWPQAVHTAMASPVARVGTIRCKFQPYTSYLRAVRCYDLSSNSSFTCASGIVVTYRHGSE